MERDEQNSLVVFHFPNEFYLFERVTERETDAQFQLFWHLGTELAGVRFSLLSCVSLSLLLSSLSLLPLPLIPYPSLSASHSAFQIVNKPLNTQSLQILNGLPPTLLFPVRLAIFSDFCRMEGFSGIHIGLNSLFLQQPLYVTTPFPLTSHFF